MKYLKSWKFLFSILMVILSAVFYYIHYVLFHDSHHIFIYLVGDIAFVFIEVLLVSIIIHQLLNEWEKKSHLKKINMVVETFFSEFGKHILAFFAGHDKNAAEVQKLLNIKEECPDLNFKKIISEMKTYKGDIDIEKVDLAKLKKYLKEKRSLLVNLLQNPNLLEHETFSETLMSVFHITEELAVRNIKKLSKEDLLHTKEDLERAYKNLTDQWLNYMSYTQNNFPYFYLYAIKTNPFNDKSEWMENWFDKSLQTP